MKHQNLEGKKLKTFNILKELGKGAWAIVYEAIDERDGSQVAMKVIPLHLMRQTPKLNELVGTQVRVLRQCKNQNVIRFVDTTTTDKSLFIVMEYCNGGDLDRYLETKKRLTEDQATIFLKQIINGFKGLHEVNAMHRDFKLANVLLHNGVCKIADLGFAKQMEKTQSLTKTILGTSLTMAPQLLEQKPYGLEADIWSVGVVYYQLIYGKYPYMGMNDYDILKKIKKDRPDFSGINISDKARDFIDKCLTIDPKKRISWRQIYDHPLIKSEQKMLYGLASRISFKENKDFYQRDVKVDEDLMYAEKKNGFAKKPFNLLQQKAEVAIASNNTADMIKKNEEKKNIDLAIQRYSKIYLNRRNNIMFIFKFVTPYVYNLFNINANHGITLFIVSKKAYIDMKEFYNYARKQVNFLKVNPYFNEFIKSHSYKELLNTIKSDIDIILAQINTYKQDIQYCSGEIKKEFDVEKVYHNKWEEFVKQTISSYEFQLAEGLERLKKSEKIDVVKVIEALIYYKDHAQNADIEEFDRKIESLDYEMSEVRINERKNQLLVWN